MNKLLKSVLHATASVQPSKNTQPAVVSVPPQEAPEFIWDYDTVVGIESQVKMEEKFMKWSIDYAHITNKVLRYVGEMLPALDRVHNDLANEEKKIAEFQEKHKEKLSTFKKIHPKIVEGE